jgi:tetratricopeptide (TPR) repeat protein
MSALARAAVRSGRVPGFSPLSSLLLLSFPHSPASWQSRAAASRWPQRRSMSSASHPNSGGGNGPETPETPEHSPEFEEFAKGLFGSEREAEQFERVARASEGAMGEMPGSAQEAEERMRARGQFEDLGAEPGTSGGDENNRELLFHSAVTRSEKSVVLTRLAGELQDKGEKHWPDALRQYDLALQYDRRNTLAMLNKAVVLRDMGRPDEGVAVAQEAARRETAKGEDGRSDELLAELKAFCGWVFLEQRRLLKAQEALRQANAHFPSEEFEGGLRYATKMVGDLEALATLRSKQDIDALFGPLRRQIEEAQLPVEVRESAVHGIGLFSTRRLAKGTSVLLDRALGVAMPWVDDGSACRGCGRWLAPDQSDAFHYVDTGRRNSVRAKDISALLTPDTMQKLRDDVRLAQGMSVAASLPDFESRRAARAPCRGCQSSFCDEPGCLGSTLQEAICQRSEGGGDVMGAYHMFVESAKASPSVRLAGEMFITCAVSGDEEARRGLHAALRAMVYVPNSEPALSDYDNQARDALHRVMIGIMAHRGENVAEGTALANGWEALMLWVAEPDWFVRLLTIIELNGVQSAVNVLSVFSRIGQDRVLHFDTDPVEHASAVALYPVVSTINHACEPNVEIVVDPHDPRWTMRKPLRLVTTEHVLADQELFISYDQPLTADAPDVSESTKVRRQSLYEDRMFWCSCPSCVW